jgi:hypothetical protein
MICWKGQKRRLTEIKQPLFLSVPFFLFSYLPKELEEEMKREYPEASQFGVDIVNKQNEDFRGSGAGAPSFVAFQGAGHALRGPKPAGFVVSVQSRAPCI